MLSVAPTRVALPLLPVVVKVIAGCFEEKVNQSVEDK
jgi:hypothetical protein